MLHKWALVRNEDSVDVNTLLWDGEVEYPVYEGYSLVLAGDANIGWRCVDGVLSCPDPVDLTIEEIVSINSAIKTELLDQTYKTMTPLLLALHLGTATDKEIGIATALQNYCKDIEAVDLNEKNPQWPEVTEIEQ